MNAARKREIRVLAEGSARGALHSLHTDSALLRFLNVYSPSGFVLTGFSDLIGIGAVLTLSALVSPRALMNPGGALHMGLVAVGVGVLAFAVIRMNRARQKTRALRDRGQPFCLWCGYELPEDVARGRCPECGGGYSRAINERIVKLTWAAARPDYGVVVKRARRLWARAVREREFARGPLP